MFIFDEQISRGFSQNQGVKLDMLKMLSHVMSTGMNERCVLLIALPSRRRPPLTNFFTLLIAAGWELRFYVPEISSSLQALAHSLIMDDSEDTSTNVLTMDNVAQVALRSKWREDKLVAIWTTASIAGFIDGNELILKQKKEA